MAAALVGSRGAVSTSTSGGSITPAWGTGENRTAGNLLVLWVSSFGTNTAIAAPSGWTAAIRKAGTGKCTANVYYKTATGGDAAPTLSGVTSTVQIAQLAEYSGVFLDKNGAVNLDRVSSASGTSPQVATNPAPDLVPGSLILACGANHYSIANTNTGGGHTLNNGATAVETNNSGTLSANHYGFAHGITTGNSVADTDTYGFVTTNFDDEANVLASFEVAVVGSAARSITDTISPAGTRTAIAAVARSITDTITVAATRTAIAAAARSITDTITVAGTRTAIAAAVQAIVDTITVSGTRTAFGAAARSIVDTITSAGTRTTFGAADRPITDAITAAGTHTGIGTAELDIIYTVTASGQRDTFAAADLPIVYTTNLSGVRTAVGSASVDEVLTIIASSNPFIHGAANLPIVLTIIATGPFPPGDIGQIVHSERGDIADALYGRLLSAGRGRLTTNPKTGIVTKASIG